MIKGLEGLSTQDHRTKTLPKFRFLVFKQNFQQGYPQ